ncbi:PAS domain S-box protein [Sinirhodobacter populi]|nr:PAS domain S-box protein [Sinirhodobacter populi]
MLSETRMSIALNLRLGTKLPLMLVSVSFVALAIMGLSSYHLASTMLITHGTQRLEQALGSRREVLRHWSEQQLSSIRAAGLSAGALRAARDFQTAWERIGPDPGPELRRIFVDHVAPDGGYSQPGVVPHLSDYTLQHRRYSGTFSALVEQNGLLDIFLVGPGGEVFYSHQKDANFATNLFDGNRDDPDLVRVVREALEARTSSGPFISLFTRDFTHPRSPRVVYLSVPLRSEGGEVLGALVFEVPLAPLSDTMGDPNTLGSTGQGYLVDGGRTLQTPLRDIPRPVDGKFDIPEDVVTRALRGEAGQQDGRGIDGTEVISAYAPVDLFGRRFAAIVEQTTKEIYAPARALAREMVVNGGLVLALLAAVSGLLARSVSGPLTQLTQMIRKIAEGRYDTAIRGTERGDEVGDMARALGGLRDDLARAEAAQLEATIQGTAFRTSSAAMMMVDSDFVIIYVNDALVRLLRSRQEEYRLSHADFPTEDLVGRSIGDFHAMPDHLREILGDPANLPYHVDIVVGDVRFGLDVNEISLPEKGQIGFVIEWRDVTEIRMNRALLSAIGNTQLIMELSPEGRVTRVNENLSTALGISAEDLQGRSYENLICCETSGFWQQLQQLEPVVGRFSLRVAGGPLVIAEGSMTSVPDRHGCLLKIVLIANDVTESHVALKAERERADAMLEDQKQVVEALRIGLKALSTGDLSINIRDDFPFEYEQLRQDFNVAAQNLSEAIQVVIDNAASIDREARDISDAAEDLSHRTERQASTLEQTAAALDELTASVSSATAGVMDANRVVKLARESAESSGRIVQEAVDAMGEIEESSRKISRIIGVIDDIAFQTNLLALNAGVEAARAGEAGRGFAVVASEVRALAQRSSDAAREIDGLITASSNHVRCGVDLVGETGNALEKILVSVNDIASRMAEIAASSHEQASGLSEINIAVNQLDQVTQHNAAMFEETTAASHALTRGAQALAAAAAQFRTSKPARVAEMPPEPPAAMAATGRPSPGNAMRLVHAAPEGRGNIHDR